MKHFTLFKTWLLAVVMLLVGAGGVWAEKVADYTQIVSGKSYRIGATVSSVDYYFVVSDAISASVQGGVTQNAADATPFKFVGNETSWTIQFMNDNFLSLKSSKDNGKVVVQSSSSTWTLSNNSSRIRMNVGDTYALQFNTSLKDRFGSYANTQTDLWVEEIQSASDPYTVSFDAGTGTYEGGDIAEDSGGAGVTLPAATGCGEWTFAGWATTAVSETTDTPELLLEGEEYYPTDDITLYAVYSMSEGGGATEATLTITEADFTGVSYADNNGDHVKASSTNEDITYNTNQIYQNSSAMQWQRNNGSLYNKTDLGSITKIEVIGSANYLTVREGSSADPTSGTTVTATGTDPYTYNLSGSNGFAHLKTGTLSMTTSVKFYYTMSSGTTTYNSNPDCSVASILTSEDVFNLSAYVNQTAEDMFEVEAFNLTADMSFALTGDDATMFDYDLDDDFDLLEGGFVYVYYKPTDEGNHTATLTISNDDADDVEITLSGEAIYQLEWVNLQRPGSGEITLGGSYDVYGHVYHPGLTTEDGNEADIQAWVGYSTDNTAPDTWTNWVEASFDEKQGNNYQYMLDLGAEIDAPGTYYYAFRYKLGDAEYVYGGFNNTDGKNGGFWGDDNVSGVLTIKTDTSKDINWGNVQDPTSGSIFLGEDFTVYGQVYKAGVTDQDGINENVKAWLGFTTDFTTNPADWDEGAWSVAEINENYEGNNYEFMFNIASAITSAGEYFYVYRYQYEDGAYYYGGTDNKAWNENDLNFGELTVDVLTAPEAQQPSGNLFKHVEANWSKVKGVGGYILSVYQKETVQAEVDHATNGSFEAWTGTKPDGWFGSKSSIAQKDVVEYTESAQEGNKAVQLINTDTSHKRFTTDVVTVQENTEYTITFWARGKGEIRTAIYDGRSTGSGYSTYNDYVEVDSDEWVEYSQMIAAEVDTDEAEFIFSLRNTVADNGHLQIDNVSITAEVDVENKVHVSGSPVTVTDEDNDDPNKEGENFMYIFSGLKRTTAYYYSVVAYKGEMKSPVSNEIFFMSGPRTDVDQTASSKAIYAYDAKVFVNTTAGESIDVFNIAGQKISTTIAQDGLNIIPVNYSGIVVVKVGDKVAKLSL